MKNGLIILIILTLSNCGMVGGAINGFGDDVFKLIEYGADRLI